MGYSAHQLPLDTWRHIIGYHPFHFWGLFSTAYMPVTSECNTVVTEYAWQNVDMVGRSEIKRAIEVAEARLAEHLDYYVGRHFVTETLQYPRPLAGGQQYAFSIGSDGRWLGLKLGEGYIRNLGVETRTLIDTPTVTYSAANGGAVQDTFTVTVASTLADMEQIAVYFTAADRLDGQAVSERWRIKPLQITTNGTTITIVGRKWLAVKPVNYESYLLTANNGIDVDSGNGPFITEVEVYRRYCDPTGTTNDTVQALLVWETAPYPIWATACGDSSAPTFSPNSQDPAAVAYALARGQIRDARLGEISVGDAVYDSSTQQWVGTNWGLCRQPDRLIIRYEAGAKIAAMENIASQTLEDGRWDEVVARLAAAELSQRICACDTANRELYRWQFDLARAAGANDEQYRIGDANLNNPFGTRAGAVYAWEQVKNLAIQRAILF